MTQSTGRHTFIANTVAMIQDESTPRQWQHVDTCANPATLRPEGQKVLNYTSWSCGFTAQSFCGRTRNIGLKNRPTCRICLKMTVNAENAQLEQT